MDEDKSLPVDLGHDAIDGEECKDGRSRTWMILLYEDDPTHKVVLDERLAELDWNYAGRIHDQDPGVKPHHHVVVIFKDGRKKKDVAADLGIDARWLRAWDRQKKAFRYLCHRDNPEKFQYSTDGFYGTMAEKASAACSKGDTVSEGQSVKEIVDFLESIDGYVTYSFFLASVSEKGLFSVFRRMGILGARLIDEHNNGVRAQIHAEVNRATEHDKLQRIQEHADALPFDQRCEILERKGFPPKFINEP